MYPAGLAVLHAQAGEELVRLRPRRAQLNRSAPRGTMVQRNVDPVLRQRGKALVGPFYCRHGLAGEILDQSCRFKLAGRSEYGTDPRGQAAGVLDHIRESRRMSGWSLPSAMRPDPARFRERAPSCRLRAVRRARSFLPREARGRSLGLADQYAGAMWTPVSTAGSTWRSGERQAVSPWLAG